MLKIDQEIVDQIRSNCPKWNVCLSGDMSFCCKVKEGGDCLIMEPPSNRYSSSCPFNYKVNDNDSHLHVCTCPLRKEIYSKYEI